MDSLYRSFLGNQAAKRTLALYKQSGRFPHTVLIEGQPGTGRKTFARLMAAAAQCSDPDGPCGTCRSCRKILAGIHPDVILADGAGGARSFHISEIRSLKNGAYVKPNEAERKIYILAEAQNMTVQAQNALLKVLEEPPGGVMFILTCDNRARLLDTILSRAAVIQLEPLPLEECRRALEEKYPGKDPEELKWLCHAFAGSLGRCIAGVEDEKLRLQVQRSARILEKIYSGSDYALLAELAPLEANRGEWECCLEQLHAACAAGYIGAWKEGGGSSPLSPLQYKKILAIIEKAAEFSRQNVGLPLLTAWMAAELRLAAM